MNNDYWICPWCHCVNWRDHEGLDQCCECGSETHTRYQGFSDRLAVVLAREPGEAIRPISPIRPISLQPIRN